MPSYKKQVISLFLVWSRFKEEQVSFSRVVIARGYLLARG
jgi:hypothetical protein